MDVMVTLTVGNSYSKISGLTASQEKSLKDLLSYTIGGNSAFFSAYGPRKKSLLKRGEFPTGLWPRVEYFLYDNQLKWTVTKKPLTPIENTDRYTFNAQHLPYEYQMEAAAKALQYHRGIISMPTGTGKSLVIALIASRLNVKTLVVVPSLEIKKQLSESLLEAFKGTHKIVIQNIDSAVLDTMTDFDCLIIDEAHHVAANTYHKLNKIAWAGIYYRFFLTATPFRNDTEETLLFESIAGQVIYQLTYKDAVKNKSIVPIEAYYINIPEQGTDAYTYAQVYKELVVENTTRNTILSDLLKLLSGKQKSTLCLVREVNHGKILSDLAGVPFVSGEDDASRDFIGQFNSGRLKSLIGTTGILGEGVDTKPCEYVIIAGLGKAKSQFMQQVGRAVRKYEGKESAKVIIFKDKSHKFLIRHFNAQKTILKDEYGVVCQEIVL